MFLHLGRNTVVREKDIIGIFEMDKTTKSERCRKYLSNKEKDSKILYITQKIPKSYVVCTEDGKEKIFVSQLMVSTLLKRMKSGDA
jgi:hypothetical protein